MSKVWQQGDVVLAKVKEFPTGKRTYKADLVLAEGEVTGHAHRIVFDGNRIGIGKVFKQNDTPKEIPPQIRMFTAGGKTFVEAPVPFAVTHEEHKRIDVPPGNYEVKIVREYDHFLEESRAVAD